MSSTSSAICLFSCQGHWPTFPHGGFLNLPQPLALASSPIDFLVNHKGALPSTLGTFPLLLPKLPIFPKANQSHIGAFSHISFCFLSSPSFPRPTTVTHWSLLSKNYSMSAKLNSYTPSSPAMSFLSQFSEQLVQITPIVQSHQHHPSLHPLLTLSFLSINSELKWAYHFHQPLAPVLNFLSSIIHPVPPWKKAQLLLI